MWQVSKEGQEVTEVTVVRELAERAPTSVRPQPGQSFSTSPEFIYSVEVNLNCQFDEILIAMETDL